MIAAACGGCEHERKKKRTERCTETCYRRRHTVKSVEATSLRSDEELPLTVSAAQIWLLLQMSEE